MAPKLRVGCWCGVTVSGPEGAHPTFVPNVCCRGGPALTWRKGLWALSMPALSFRATTKLHGRVLCRLTGPVPRGWGLKQAWGGGVPYLPGAPSAGWHRVKVWTWFPLPARGGRCGALPGEEQWECPLCGLWPVPLTQARPGALTAPTSSNWYPGGNNSVPPLALEF